MNAKTMAQAGAYFTIEDGQVVSLRDLLERERGREVSENEAMNYCLRHRNLPSHSEAIARFIKYAKNKKHDHTTM